MTDKILTAEEAWDFLTETGIATNSEMVLVTTLNGYRLDVLESVLFVRTGYRTFEQYAEAEEN